MRRRPPEPPYPPPRARSRSRARELDRLHIKLQEILAAHRRNTQQRRGGRRPPQRRTRAIHRQILGILAQLLGSLLQITGLADPGRRQLEVRQRQAQDRLDWLNSPTNNNFPENKFLVVPDLQEYAEQQDDMETFSIDSNSINDPLEVPPSESEEEEDQEGPFSDPYMRERWRQLISNPERFRELEDQVLRGGPISPSVLNLPGHLRTGSRVGASPSSSTDPRLVASSKAKASPRPKLQPTPKNSPVPSNEPKAGRYVQVRAHRDQVPEACQQLY